MGVRNFGEWKYTQSLGASAEALILKFMIALWTGNEAINNPHYLWTVSELCISVLVVY